MEGKEFYNPPFAFTGLARPVQFIVENWYLILVALLSGTLLLWPSIRGGSQGARSLSTTEAVRLINREKAVVIDVRDAAEFEAGHLVNARSIPLATIETATPGGKGLPTNKAANVIVVCPTGSRSTKAVALLTKLGYQNVYSLAGGLKAWREANLPLEKPEKKSA